MKKFNKNLAIGLAIAVFAALEICYFVWSFHSMHRMIWFIVVGIACGLNAHYLSSSDTLYEDINGNKRIRKMTMREKTAVAMCCTMGMVMLGGLLWAIGYGTAYILEWGADFWEMYLLYGVVTVAVIGAIVWAIYLMMHFSTTDNAGKQAFFAALKNVLLWIIILAISLAAASAILKYLLPFAMQL